MVSPYTVVPGTRTPSMLLHPAVTPYTVRPFRIGGPDWIAQRFYFRASTPAEVEPVFDGAWDITAGALRRALATSRLSTDTLAFGSLISWTSGQQALDRQYVSAPLRPGVSFNGATATTYLRGAVPSADDNAFPRFGLRLVSMDGAAELAVLLAVGDYGSGSEFSTTGELRRFAAQEPLASYVTQGGERLVAEIGFSDAAGTTPQARIATGYGSSAADDHIAEEGSQAARNFWLDITPAAA